MKKEFIGMDTIGSILDRIYASGGGNILNYDSVDYDSGYMVGIENIAIVSRLELSKMLPKLLKDYQYSNIGFWIDENGMCHIDLSTNISDLLTATTTAIDLKELAIWDCEKFEEIRIGGDL